MGTRMEPHRVSGKFDELFLTDNSQTVNPVGIKKSRKHEAYKKLFSIRDRQQYLNRFTWHGLPPEIDQNLLERMLYLRGKLAFFFFNGQFYILPFALSGNIDIYGRYKGITPYTFNGTAVEHEPGTIVHQDSVWMNGLEFEPVYDLAMPTKGSPAVILTDYSLDVSQDVLPRYKLQEVFFEDMADVMMIISQDLYNSVITFAIVVNDEGQKNAVMDELLSMETDLRKYGINWQVITSKNIGEIQELKKQSTLNTQSYFEAFVSIDNLRELMLGIENNGVFKKKERQLVGEMELEAGSSDMVLQDALYLRQQFADRINIVFGLNVWVDINEMMKGQDVDGDGTIGDDTDDQKITSGEE